jgi:hypothetical protein
VDHLLGGPGLYRPSDLGSLAHHLGADAMIRQWFWIIFTMGVACGVLLMTIINIITGALA